MQVYIKCQVHSDYLLQFIHVKNHENCQQVIFCIKCLQNHPESGIIFKNAISIEDIMNQQCFDIHNLHSNVNTQFQQLSKQILEKEKLYNIIDNEITKLQDEVQAKFEGIKNDMKLQVNKIIEEQKKLQIQYRNQLKIDDLISILIKYKENDRDKYVKQFFDNYNIQSQQIDEIANQYNSNLKQYEFQNIKQSIFQLMNKTGFRTLQQKSNISQIININQQQQNKELNHEHLKQFNQYKEIYHPLLNSPFIKNINTIRNEYTQFQNTQQEKLQHTCTLDNKKISKKIKQIQNQCPNYKSKILNISNMLSNSQYKISDIDTLLLNFQLFNELNAIKGYQDISKNILNSEKNQEQSIYSSRIIYPENDSKNIENFFNNNIFDLISIQKEQKYVIIFEINKQLQHKAQFNPEFRDNSSPYEVLDNHFVLKFSSKSTPASLDSTITTMNELTLNILDLNTLQQNKIKNIELRICINENIFEIIYNQNKFERIKFSEQDKTFSSQSQNIKLNLSLKERLRFIIKQAYICQQF